MYLIPKAGIQYLTLPSVTTTYIGLLGIQRTVSYESPEGYNTEISYIYYEDFYSNVYEQVKRQICT